VESGAAHQQAPLWADFIGQGLQLLSGQVLRGDVDEVSLAGVAVLPPMRFRRRVVEAFQLGQRLGQLRSVVFGIDDRVAPAVVDDQARGKTVIAEAAAAVPT
jgi:hypothetical protein